LTFSKTHELLQEFQFNLFTSKWGGLFSNRKAAVLMEIEDSSLMIAELFWSGCF